MSIYKKIFVLLILFLFLFSSFSPYSSSVFGKEKKKKIETIEVEIIKEKDEEEKPKVIYDPIKVEKARKINKKRILGLLFFWAILLTLLVMIRMILRHEKRLIDQGYYKTDLNH